MSRHYFPLSLALLGFALFSSITFWHVRQPQQLTNIPEGSDRVVIKAPVLLILAGGDNFLAANLEAMRLAATGVDDFGVDTDYLIRAQHEVSRLNPCHEDNYYLANGLLTWGGAVDQGNRILDAAISCRFWDGVPPFFYGVNRVFFDRDKDAAIRAFELSADRWPDNAATLRRLAITLRAEQFADERLAVNYLVYQRDSTDDPKLREMLSKRVIRLQGLIELREAQRRYEAAHGVLTDLQQLVSSGELAALPQDPLRLGYELRDGRIEMKKLKIAGMENQP